MENDIKQEINSLRKELEALKKESVLKERFIRRLTIQLRKATKTLKSVKERTRRNANAIDSIKNTLRAMSR